MMKSSVALTSSISKERKNLCTTLTVPVFWKSLDQNNYLQKPISGLGRTVLPLIIFMDKLSVYAALLRWYYFRSIYRYAFSAVVGSAVVCQQALSSKGRFGAVRPLASAGPLSGGLDASQSPELEPQLMPNLPFP